MSTLRRLISIVAVVGAAIGVSSLPAEARIVEPPTPYSGQFTSEECEGAFVVEGSLRGVSWVTDARGTDGQAFLENDRYRDNATWTSVETGRSFTLEGQGLFRELTATFVPNEDVPAEIIPPQGLVGPVYLFTWSDSGAPFTVKDSDGRVVVADRGTIYGEQLFDTLGDSQPGGVALGDGEITRVVGSFPGLDVDICELGLELTR